MSYLGDVTCLHQPLTGHPVGDVTFFDQASRNEGKQCPTPKDMKQLAYLLFSVTRRSRSDGSHSLTEWTLADLTDVTLVSDDTF